MNESVYVFFKNISRISFMVSQQNITWLPVCSYLSEWTQSGRRSHALSSDQEPHCLEAGAPEYDMQDEVIFDNPTTDATTHKTRTLQTWTRVAFACLWIIRSCSVNREVVIVYDISF